MLHYWAHPVLCRNAHKKEFPAMTGFPHWVLWLQIWWFEVLLDVPRRHGQRDSMSSGAGR